MWRFLLPAVAMMAALVVLFAGALGDLKSLPDLSDRMIGVVGDEQPRRPVLPPSPVTPAPPATALPPALSASALAAENAAREAVQKEIAALQKQVGDLQQQVSQRSRDLDAERVVNSKAQQDLDATRAEADKLHQDIDALRQQRRAEEAALARQRAQAQQMAAARPPPASTPAPTQPNAAPPPAPVPRPSATEQLLAARQWLATGRPDEARRVLAMVQTQMVLQPVSPDQPIATGTSQSAGDIGNAIRWLDMGANNQAMLAINRAIDNSSSGGPPSQPWSGYPPSVLRR